MLQIKCPWCGERCEREFNYGGDASVSRPSKSETASGQAWLDYVYLRDNPRGPHLEYWYHRAGCQRWFKVVRNTHTNEVMATGEMALELGGGVK